METSTSEIRSNESNKCFSSINERIAKSTKTADFDTLSKDSIKDMEYEDFDIESYKEYPKKLRNDANPSRSSISTSIVNFEIKNKADNQPITSSLCKLEKFSKSSPKKVPISSCVKSYIIGKNEIQLATKPPIKVTIEPTDEQSKTSVSGSPQQSLNKKQESHKKCSDGSVRTANNFLMHRGSMLFPDPIKTTLVNSLLTRFERELKLFLSVKS